jgi:hypothetical protein
VRIAKRVFRKNRSVGAGVFGRLFIRQRGPIFESRPDCCALCCAWLEKCRFPDEFAVFAPHHNPRVGGSSPSSATFAIRRIRSHVVAQVRKPQRLSVFLSEPPSVSLSRPFAADCCASRPIAALRVLRASLTNSNVRSARRPARGDGVGNNDRKTQLHWRGLSHAPLLNEG